MPEIARGSWSYKAAVTGGQIRKPSGIALEVETFLARRLSLADQNTSQWNVLRRNLSAVYPAWSSREDSSLDLARNSQTRPLEPSAQNDYDRTGGQNYYFWDNSKFRAEFGVLCNLEDHDFNGYLSDHTNKSVTVSRPQLYILHNYVWRDTCTK